MSISLDERVETERAGSKSGEPLKWEAARPVSGGDGPRRVVYVNGHFVPEAAAAVSLYDSALMYGDMAFEFTRTFGHAPFRLREHLDRLYASLKILRIDCRMNIAEMEAATQATLQQNLKDLPREMDVQILHDVSRGIMGVYHRVFAADRAAEPTVLIAVYPLDLHLAEVARHYQAGVKAVMPRQLSIPSRLLDPKMKTRSRQHYKIAELMANEIEPGAWALLMDEDGFLTEGTGSNVFIVKNGRLLTPEPRNILRGVSRAMALELAEKLGIPCRECNLDPYDAYTADEAFFTSTRFCILGIRAIDGFQIGGGQPGPLTNRLLAAWSAEVGVDIAQQARDYAAAIARQGAPCLKTAACIAKK